jgi:penicillin amidase
VVDGTVAPTFNVVVADVHGWIAVQSSGRGPLRKIPERGYRPGWEVDHQWIGLLPFDAMPHAINPERGWLATANNRLAADDYPYPLYGTWPAGLRAARIREMIEDRLNPIGGVKSAGFAWGDFREMQHDTVSMRAVACVPSLLTILADDIATSSGSKDDSRAVTTSRRESALRHLANWGYRVDADSVGATLFNVFFAFWCKAVIGVRFSGTTAESLVKHVDGLASRLLAGDEHGWFPDGQRVATIRQVLTETLAYLGERLGPEVAAWHWGRLHTLPLKHFLSSRGDLGRILDYGGEPIKGDAYTVCNTGCGPDWQANLAGGYRLIADLATKSLLAVDASSQSGHPGSAQYSDQLSAWTSGDYHVVPLDKEEVSKLVVNRLRVSPETT